MTPEIIIRDCEAKDIREMADKMRDDDKREIESVGWSVNKGLWRSFKGSLVCKTIFVDGEIAAVFGLGGELFGDTAAPWLLTTPACKKVSSLRFAKIYQEEVMKMLKLFPSLENYVLSSYDKAVKLLENIGFTIGKPEMFEGVKEPYSKFSMRAS